MSKIVGTVVRISGKNTYGVFLGRGAEDVDIKTLVTNSVELTNAKVVKEDNTLKLVGTNGSLNRYAKPIKGQIVDYNIVILAELFDANSGEAIGYKIATPSGRVFSYSKEKVLKLVKTLTSKYSKSISDYTPIANGKIVFKDGVEFISSIKGNYPSIKVDSKDSKKSTGTSAPEGDLKVLVAAVREARVKSGGHKDVISTFEVFVGKNRDKATTMLNDLRGCKSLQEMSNRIAVKRGKIAYIKSNGEKVILKEYNSWKSNRPKANITPLFS